MEERVRQREAEGVTKRERDRGERERKGDVLLIFPTLKQHTSGQYK
jgi:hypothetical protein